MKVLFHKKVQKFLRKTKNKQLFQIMRQQVDLIILHPEKGELLEHPFRKYRIRSVHFLYEKIDYRIAYTFHQKTDELIFLLIDARENFYEKLRRNHS